MTGKQDDEQEPLDEVVEALAGDVARSLRAAVQAQLRGDINRAFSQSHGSDSSGSSNHNQSPKAAARDVADEAPFDQSHSAAVEKLRAPARDAADEAPFDQSHSAAVEKLRAPARDAADEAPFDQSHSAAVEKLRAPARDVADEAAFDQSHSSGGGGGSGKLRSAPARDVADEAPFDQSHSAAVEKLRAPARDVADEAAFDQSHSSGGGGGSGKLRSAPARDVADEAPFDQSHSAAVEKLRAPARDVADEAPFDQAHSSGGGGGSGKLRSAPARNVAEDQDPLRQRVADALRPIIETELRSAHGARPEKPAGPPPAGS